jgi:predicted dienelactone hydrolase
MGTIKLDFSAIKINPYLVLLILISAPLSGCFESPDVDSDGISDNTDNCINIANPSQNDTDFDGVGNECDVDDDGDLTLDVDDELPLNPNETSDLDGDGKGDNSDSDRDGDGVGNGKDAFPNDSTEWLDTDGDGIGNNADNDDDNDGLLDINDHFDLTPYSSLSSPGPFNIGSMELTFNSPRGHEITVQLWYPTSDESGEVVIYDRAWLGEAIEDATPDCSEPRPVTIYSHGFPSIRWASAYLSEHLASHGFFSIAPDHRYSTLLDVQIDNFAEMMLARPIDISESFDWLSMESQVNGMFQNCIDPDSGFAIMGQSTGGFTSMMISGAEILLSDLQNDCDNPDSGGIDEINPGSSCEMIEIWQSSNSNPDVINMQDDRSWATVLLAPWNGSLLRSGISKVDSDIFLLASDIDETVPLSEINQTRILLGDNVIHSSLLIDAGHYHYAPIGCAVRTCVGNLSIGDATNFTNESVLLFLTQLLNWPGAEDYSMPEPSYVEWRN